MELMKGSKPFSFKNDSEVGVLVLQGITGTTSSVIYLGEYLSKKGLNVEGPRLSRHGTSWQDLSNVKYKEWIDDIEAALSTLKKRASKIFVSGLSMGGMLSLYLAENHPEIIGLILINPSVVFKDPRIPFVPVLRFLIKATPGIGSDIKDPSQKEICYEKTPTNAVYEMLKLTSIVRKEMNKVTQPVLIFKSKEDHVVPKVNANYIYNNVSSKEKEIVWLLNSYHVATMDYDKEEIGRLSFEFIKKYKQD